MARQRRPRDSAGPGCSRREEDLNITLPVRQRLYFPRFPISNGWRTWKGKVSLRGKASRIHFGPAAGTLAATACVFIVLGFQSNQEALWAAGRTRAAPCRSWEGPQPGGSHPALLYLPPARTGGWSAATVHRDTWSLPAGPGNRAPDVWFCPKRPRRCGPR